MHVLRAEIDGRPATVEELLTTTTVNYGHFTGMTAVDGRVRGLDLHLDRLGNATKSLFGTTLDTDRVRTLLRQALSGLPGPVNARINVFPAELSWGGLGDPIDSRVLVLIRPAPEVATAPLRTRTVRYSRDAPEFKHVGTFGLFQQQRLARLAGYADVVFLDERGRLSEGSIWNLGLFDGERIVWPEADVLPGIAYQLLRRGLAQLGVPEALRPVEPVDLPGFRAAFFTNATTGARALSCVDEVEFAVDPDLMDLLRRAYELAPWDQV
ncbi:MULTISPECIES: aminotransferase class IV [unclassified Crossiella]|uniref:aminotransferase class IV n=1 Tax=unclassified Crossiella TaxID=2620835 RepID=UPI001FFFF2E2|nr:MULTISPECIES: aminotransferase class IV [unclassified Crossiella]MCK2240199.1 aminotransferase class IV [Crossiella sp. S99.2]MCK2253349.1 aminotransferase class IV [Crossiella sp. S99.1]